MKALGNQCAQISLTSRAVFSEELGKLGQRLAGITGLAKTLAMNTGAEAVETALKAARAWGYKCKKIPDNKAEIIVACNNFHGRTYGAISASSRASSTDNFGPLLPGFVKVKFDDPEEIRRAITLHTCAVFIEPIQGEGGIVVPQRGYLKALRKICNETNTLLILDEVQSGMGRTGKWFCYQHEKILPDGVCIGKALGGGVYPVSAFVATKELMDVFTPGTHGSTFGGNPLACRIAEESIDVIIEENLLERSQHLSVVFHEKLEALQKKYPTLITDVRGKGYGLWAGVQLNADAISARAFCETLLQYGVLTKDTHQNVIRLAPPLTIKESDLSKAIRALDKALKSL